MIKFTNKGSYDYRYAKLFSMWENDRVIISGLYSKGFSDKYLTDLLMPFTMLTNGVVMVLSSPFVLLFTLLSFIPKITIIKKEVDNNEGRK